MSSDRGWLLQSGSDSDSDDEARAACQGEGIFDGLELEVVPAAGGERRFRVLPSSSPVPLGGAAQAISSLARLLRAEENANAAPLFRASSPAVVCGVGGAPAERQCLRRCLVAALGPTSVEIIKLEAYRKVPAADLPCVSEGGTGLLDAYDVKQLSADLAATRTRLSFDEATTTRPEPLVVVEGCLALHEELRPLFDVTISVVGGVRGALQRRVWRNASLKRNGLAPVQESAVAEALFESYSRDVEPTLRVPTLSVVVDHREQLRSRAPMYVIRARQLAGAPVTAEAARAALGPQATTTEERFADTHVRPPSATRSALKHWLRVRATANGDADARVHSVVFREYVADTCPAQPDLTLSDAELELPLIQLKEMHFETSRNALAGLLNLGYEVGLSINRSATVLSIGDEVGDSDSDDCGHHARVTVSLERVDEFPQLGFVQIKSVSRERVRAVAQSLGLGPADFCKAQSTLESCLDVQTHGDEAVPAGGPSVLHNTSTESADAIEPQGTDHLAWGVDSLAWSTAGDESVHDSSESSAGEDCVDLVEASIISEDEELSGAGDDQISSESSTDEESVALSGAGADDDDSDDDDDNALEEASPVDQAPAAEPLPWDEESVALSGAGADSDDDNALEETPSVDQASPEEPLPWDEESVALSGAGADSDDDNALEETPSVDQELFRWEEASIAISDDYVFEGSSPRMWAVGPVTPVLQQHKPGFDPGLLALVHSEIVESRRHRAFSDALSKREKLESIRAELAKTTALIATTVAPCVLVTTACCLYLSASLYASSRKHQLQR
mmetsp:Transcript_26236/g.86171  ORF Transcript_26236/g.86171 Transcript_26236/m.86171 type:complete len:795 (-) Transcript_26236:1664-4048(-)